MLNTARTVAILKRTGGVPIDFDGQAQSWGHFENVPVLVDERDGFGVQDLEATVVLANRAFDPMPKNKEQITLHLDLDEDGVFETPEVRTVTRLLGHETDAGLTRVFLLEP